MRVGDKVRIISDDILGEIKELDKNGACRVKCSDRTVYTYTDELELIEGFSDIEHRADHYARLKPEPIQYMQNAMSREEFRGFLLGNIIKYSLRFGHKDEPAKEAAKIADYARWLSEHEQNKKVTV